MTTPTSLNEVVGELLREVELTRTELTSSDNVRSKSIAELRTKVAKMEAAVDGLSRRIGRPSSSLDLGGDGEREQARALLELKHVMRQPKHDPGGAPFVADDTAIEEATLAVRGIKHLLQTTDASSLPHAEHKALTSFSVGSSGFLLPPEMSGRILSCLEDLMQNIQISGPSIKFMVDDVDLDVATWSCDHDCWGPGHTKSLTEGLSEIELKPEPLRYVACTSRDLLEDASVNIETWLTSKIDRAFRNAISTAIISGDGIGKPLGILNPSSGIPICDTATGTHASKPNPTISATRPATDHHPEARPKALQVMPKSSTEWEILPRP
jgi:HK97 family phage major capsid protein